MVEKSPTPEQGLSDSHSAESHLASSSSGIIGVPIPERNKPADERSGDDGLMLKDRVRQLRLAKGMTQQELAAKARITQPALSDIETGETKSLAGETLIYLARALDESPEYIQTGRRSSAKLTADDALMAILVRLTPANRALVTQLARSLVSQQPSPNAADEGPDPNSVAAEIRLALLEMIDTYGSDTVARALADNQGATGEPSKHPRTNKQKA